ncbi:MAG: sugar ABC transporter ATP-binding protein [Christensenellales bacterium]
MSCLLRVEGISKAFYGVQALEDVNFSINSSEVVALIGANGAGKSTLIKIITGVHHRDTGKVFLYDKEIHFPTPSEGKKSGIATIYQELTVIPNLNVCENIFISRIREKSFINYKLLYKEADEILKSLGLEFSSKEKVSNLSVANQQMVEIARAVSENAKILIMDEPTSALTQDEKDSLFKIVNNLKEKRLGIVFVSHRLNEVFEIADRVTILKDGKLVGHYDIKELNVQRMVELMIGKTLEVYFPKKKVVIGDTVLSIKNLSRGNKIKNVSFDLKKGEILGLTGLLGSGRTEIARCIFGVDHYDEGQILYKGNVIRLLSPRQASDSGFGMVPEDRKMLGLVLKMSIGDNICLASRYVKPWRGRDKESDISNKYIKALNIRCTGEKQKVMNLSGGNQQKVVISKWLVRNSDILILDEPTKGIDVSAKAEVHALIGDLVESGASVILISSEFDEIMGLCDRAVVLYEGEKTGEVERAAFSEELLMSLSHGQKICS